MQEKSKFEQRLAKIRPEIIIKITKIDELKGQWVGGARLDPQLLGRLKRSALITSAGASTRIEGAKLSDEDVDKLMRGIRLARFADRDKQEVKGYFELLSTIFDSWKQVRLSENTIKHLHQEMLKYVTKDERHRGEYKKVENKVVATDAAGEVIGVVFDARPAYLTPKEIQELVTWTVAALKEKKYHPLLIVANFIVEFLNIHPFQDGNGRLSRILTNMLLLQAGYPYMPYVSHEKLVEQRKPDYYLALRKSQRTFNTDREDMAPWLHFFLDIIFEQSTMAIALLSQENIEKILSPKQLLVWQYLQTVAEAHPGEIAKHTKVARPTLNQALYKLLRLKRIERIGLGRSTRYRKI